MIIRCILRTQAQQELRKRTRLRVVNQIVNNEFGLGNRKWEELTKVIPG